jgi:ABC-2 type transport system permease protein
MGGFDMRTFNQTPEWSIVTELKKQYDVSTVAPDAPIGSEVDVLLVAQPSSLTQKQIDNLTAYVKRGGATLLFLDPFPIDNPQIAPSVPRMPAGGPFGGGPPPEPKGNLHELLDLIGVEWPSSEIVWNAYNPHPKLDLQSTPEIVFIGKGSGAADAFNSEQSASSELQEIVMLFPGMLRSRTAPGLDFIPLLRTNSNMGGTIDWTDAVQQGFMGIQGINPRRRHMLSGLSYTLAARVSGRPAADADKDKDKDKGKDADKDQAKDATKKDGDKKKDEKPPTPPAKLNVIAIADLDLISEQFFELRRRKIEDLDFDNVPFVLNCVDVLAGDESFVSLRKERPRHRTLVKLEAQSNQFNEELLAATRKAENEAADELQAAQKAFDKEVEQVRSRTDWDERTKEIQLSNLQEVAQRRLDVKKQVIEDQKQIKIRESRAESERKIRRIENDARFRAAALPPLPPLILGLLVWIARLRRENLGANPKRLA